MSAAHAYYAACEGRWVARLSLSLTDPAALASSGLSWLDRLSLRALAGWPRWLPAPRMHTTVVPRGEEVVHTTTIRWLGLPVQRSVEVFRLDPDGTSLTVSGDLRGTGAVDPSAAGASYAFTWRGAAVRQRTTLAGDTVTVEQVGPGFRGVQVLRRR